MDEEREIVPAIRANSLPDFAAQLDEWVTPQLTVVDW